MAERIKLFRSGETRAGATAADDVEATALTGNEVLECDASGQIRISDIMDVVNAMNDRLVNLEAVVTNIDVNYAKIKTRRSGNILYMTDDGTNP